MCLSLLLMTAAECGLFYFSLMRFWEELSTGAMSLETLIDKSGLFAVFCAGLVMYISDLQSIGVEQGSKVGYTLRRLSVSERRVTLMQWGFNTGCLILFWLFQTVVAAGLCVWYLRVIPEGVYNHHTLVLAFYRQNFLHNLLPMADVWRWARNVLLLAAMGLVLARWTYLQRRGNNHQFVVIMMYLITSLSFQSRWDRPASNEIGIMMVCVLVLIFVLLAIWKGDDGDEQEPQEQEGAA